MSKEAKNKLSGSETEYHNFLQQKYRVLFSASAGAFSFIFMTVLLLFPSVFAFSQNTSAGNISSSTSNNTNSSTNKVNNNTQQQTKTAITTSQPPITTKISEKGIYQVQLTFISTLPIQSPNLLPKTGFQMEIDFLNASASAPTNKTIPQKESAIRGESSLGMPASQPNIIQRLVPVDSFDMAIYSNSGKVLWNKTNQAVTAGRASETISLNSNYTGPITILINNIKSSNVMTGSVTTPLSTPTLANTTKPSTAGKATPIDSVRL